MNRQGEDEVLDVARHRSDRGPGVERAHAPGDDVAGAGDAAGGRLDPGDAAEVGGQADAAAGVAAHVERGAAGADDRARAAARSTGGAAEVERVARLAVDEVVGLAREGQLGGVGLAHQDRAGSAQAGCHGRVGLGHEVLAAERAAGGDDAGGVVGVLERDRDAVERAELVAAGDRGVGGLGLLAGALGAELDDRVEVAVDLVDAGQMGFEHLGGGDLPGADCVGDCDKRGIGQVVHAWSSVCGLMRTGKLTRRIGCASRSCPSRSSFLSRAGPIDAMWRQPEGVSRGSVLCVGGFDGGFEGPANGIFAALADFLPGIGIGVLRLDFRIKTSPGPIDAGTDDVLAGLEWLAEQKAAPVALIGHSFGGAIVTPRGRAVGARRVGGGAVDADGRD